jgi:16S rRNA (uracil1498-N3)-methyltransferase
MAQAKIRLYLDHPLAPGQQLPLSEPQAHYLFAVMRLAVGAQLLVFNGSQGEWLAEVAQVLKRGGSLTAVHQIAPQRNPPDLWLLFAPIKKARTDFIVEKAAELGAARILPVQTDFTNSERVRQDRLQAHALEAAEQCGGTYVPQVAELTALSRALDTWDPARRIMWADESRHGPAETLSGLPEGPWAILIGPEGGFSSAERARLQALPFVVPVSLGPRILRADTAAVAALSLWQAQLGDWR